MKQGSKKSRVGGGGWVLSGQKLRKGGLHKFWGEEPSANYVLTYLTYNKEK